MSTTKQSHSHPHGHATPATPAPVPAAPAYTPLKWSYPFSLAGKDIAADPQTYFNALSSAEDGFFPLGANGVWHGGIHFGQGTEQVLNQQAGVRAIADGEVVAYRLDSKYPELAYKDGKFARYSTGFVLIRHKLVLPPVPKPTTTTGGQNATGNTASQPAPAASAPVATAPAEPAADESLTFFSLYMHQLDWEGYQSAERRAADASTGQSQNVSAVQRMPFWKGDKRFRVSAKATDEQRRPSTFKFAPVDWQGLGAAPSDSSSGGGLAGVLGNNIGAATSFNWSDAAGLAPSNDWRSNFSLADPTAQTSDRQTNAKAQPVVKGIYVCRLPKGEPVALLPQGSEIKVGSTIDKGWVQIAKVLKGEPVGVVVGDPVDPGAASGWVQVNQLDVLIDPNPLDCVVVLDTPFPVSAGTVVGYLGEYQRYREVSVLPAHTTSRPLLHLEVFAGPDLPGFIKKSQARAKDLRDQKGFLEVSAGAMLVDVKNPDSTVQSGLLLKVVAANSKNGCWTKVQPVRVTTPAPSPHHPHSHPHRIEQNEGPQLWVDSALVGKVTSAVLKGWSDFPLQTSNVHGPAAGFRDVFSRNELNKLGTTASAVDDKGVHWWRIEVGTREGGSRGGWVCESGHPLVQWRSSWEWPGFDLVDHSSVSVVDSFKRFLFVSKLLLDGEKESFEPSAMSVNGSELITKLEKAIDHQGDGNGTVTSQELAKAQQTRWLAEALSHLIVCYESEWGGSMSKWDSLSSLMKERQYIWQGELERIEKLQWWDKVKAVQNFPAEPTVYHLHPIGLISNFAARDLALEEARIRAFMRMIRVGEGTEGPSGYERLFGGQSFVKDYGRDFSDHPRILISRTNSRGRAIKSSAAGAYQVMGYNWDDPAYIKWRGLYGVSDFSPLSQDRYCAILLKHKRHALEAIKSGDIKGAVVDHQCNMEWASLPGNDYDQGGVTWSVVSEKFDEYLQDELSGKSDLVVSIGGMDDIIG